MTIIELKHVHKTYHENTKMEVQALKDISVNIDEGEFLVIMGESGSGKTTFLNVLTTLLPATKGNVIFEGKNTETMSEEEISNIRYSSLCFVFQDYNLLNSLNVYENIALPLMMRNKDKLMIKESVTNVCEKLGIDDLLTKYPIECSGGQQQRVAIARAMASQSKIIVADEPTGNLDSNNSNDIMNLFTNLNKAGTTIILVTHDSKVASYSNRMIYIHDGSIVKEIQKNDSSRQDYYKEIVKITSVKTRFK